MKSKLEVQTALTQKEMKRTLSRMWKIRAFEEKLSELQAVGEIYGTYHLSIGQEATAIGACSQLNITDMITSTHRNHAHCLAKGIDMRAMLAELCGKSTGTNKGKGGSMHIADLKTGNLGSNGIVGAGFPIACGAALAAQMNKTGQVVISFGGDGSVNEGAFHEALNLASIWKLPVIFFIENNLYGMSSKVSEMVNISHLSDRAIAYGIPGITIDGNDVELVMSTTKNAIEYARKGQGPTLIEAITYRHEGHSKSDKLVYRTEQESEIWKEKNDPIRRFELKMIHQANFTEEDVREIEKIARFHVEELAESVKNDPMPTKEDLLKDVYFGNVGEVRA
ncbi:pyruvate dehydrogenase E1 component alpha subunit [Pilibacter termitis]|uniref:Pyruvate dehydrogenase E1 component alpha subunit n=1 Tax=Pilibacter termitis TaxID=263852 RepID=A0A1T4N6U1_9ENTE|nr:thiamine pyrophosphate-dependent dehydrogenase E1 component subunit alpha [Pilibacter termitis]SJZ74891.1 pyruvate dehydrogenase E1 component alpha subunit [Pilibacter termitis]